MRASRLLTILMLLQTRGRMNAETLAAEVEVSVRTIYRDIDQLSAAGVPVYAERGREGGFQLLDGWRTRLTGLTTAEAQALFLTGLPGPASELGLGEAMAAAQLKLLAALPAGWQEDARRIGSRFHLDPVGWFQMAARTDHLPAIASAVWSDRRLKIRYESWDKVVERTVDPLGLVLKGGFWYLVARVNDDPRTYRLSNVLELVVLDDTFARPAGFDLEAFWTASTRRFETALYRETAVLRASSLGLERLSRLSPAVAEAVARAEKSPGSETWTRLEIPIESIDHAAGEILKLGAEAEVLEPPALRERLAETAGRLADLYLIPERDALAES